MKNCPECNSENIILDVKAIDKGDYNAPGNLQIAIDEKPDAFIFKQRAYSDIKVNVCADCGFIRFYAADLEALRYADQNRKTD